MRRNHEQSVADGNWEWDPEPIKEVRKEKEKHRDSEDLAGLKDILEHVILRASHFPLEFIQNAEDEKSTKIGFLLYDSALVIYNNGRPFRIENDRHDIKGFCSIGVSQKYKKGIGFLGVGAKTIFTITKKPWLVSGRYNFSVENMLYPSHRDELPPITSSVLHRIQEFPQRGAIFYSPLLPDADGKCDTNKIGEILGDLDQSVIMFLDSVDTIEVRDFRNNGKGVIFTRKDIESYVGDDARNEGAYTCKKIQISAERMGDAKGSEIETSEWIVGNLNISISSDAKRDLPESKLYEKKRTSKMTRISVAVPLNQKLRRSFPLYCYLPMNESDTGIPTILQGDFIPKPDRNHIQTDLLWNKEILENLGVLFAKVVETCSKNEIIELELEDLIPWEEIISPFLEPFVKSFKREIIKAELRIGGSPNEIPLRHYIICESDMRFLAEDDLRLVHLNKYSRLFLRRNSRLRRCLEWIGVKRLTAKEMLEILLKNSEGKDIDPVWAFECYNSLAMANGNGDMDEETLERMRSCAWIFTNKRKFCVPHDKLYFRMPKAKTEIHHIEDFVEVQFLHPIFTTFGGSRKYHVDKGKRDVIRRFLAKRFSVKILEDEGHLIRNLVIPLLKLKSDELSREKRVQYFTALLYYHEKLQKKLMKDGGYRSDFERGKKRLRDTCKSILVPVTTFSGDKGAQTPKGLMRLEQVYLRGSKSRPGMAFKIFCETTGAYFLSPSFYKKVSERTGFHKKEAAQSFENVGIVSGLKVLEKEYSSGDDTPFGVRRDLVDWKLRDYVVPGLGRLNLVALREQPKTVHIILKELSAKCKPSTFGKGFLEAPLRSSRTSIGYHSSVTRVLDKVELRDQEGEPHSVGDFVFGPKFAELIPNHPLLVPFDTKGMARLLSDMGLRDEPTQDELGEAIGHMMKEYDQSGKDIPRSEVERLCKIYRELSHYDSASPVIFLRSANFSSCWFKPDRCYWMDPTTQFKKYHPVIGDFYCALGMDDPELFRKFGVNPFPSVEDIFSKLSALRKRINKRKGLPSREEITELRRYYSYLDGKEMPDKLVGRKIFLTVSGKMVDGRSIYTSRNVELHSTLSRRVPDLLLNVNLAPEFPVGLKETFGIRVTESTLDRESLPHGELNNDLTVLFKLLLKMVATYEYSKSNNTQEPHITRLQQLGENVKVMDTEKIELNSYLGGSHIKVLLDTLFLGDNIYLTDIRDSERVLSRIQKHVIKTILKGCSNDTINFADRLISGGLSIDKMQESFFEQGFSKDHISQFLKEMRITQDLQFEEEQKEEEGAPEEGAEAGVEKKEKEETRKKQKRVKEKEELVPPLANPFEYEVGEITECKSIDGEGKEIGLRKRRKGKAKAEGKTPPPPAASNLGVEEIGIEFVKMACLELFGVENEDDIEDVHRDLKHYDILVRLRGDNKYVEVKSSLSDPNPSLTRDEFEKARIEKENYYLFLVGNIQSNMGDVFVRYIQNPASHKHVRLGGARLKEIKWNDWGSITFGKKTKGQKKTEKQKGS